MSTSTTPEPNPPASPPIRISAPIAPAAPGARPVETAPSAMLAEGPTFARFVGFVGLFLLVLGAVVVISTRAVGPRWVPEGFGFLFAAVGLALMLYHAVSDGEQEVRRMYGGFALFWLLFGLGASLVPGPVFDQGGATKTIGHNLLPWGVGAAFLSLMFTIPFVRHETDETYRNIAVTGLLAIGGLLAVGSVVTGIFKPDFMAGPGIMLALLGLGFLCAYLAQVDSSEGIGYTVAFAVGAFGAAVALYAIGRAAFPTLLFDGPSTLRTEKGDLNWWSVSFRVLTGVAFLVPALVAMLGRSPAWLKGVLGLVGLVGTGVVVASLITNPVTTQPRPFLVPGGLILMALGLVYLAVSLGICSDNQFVTLTRRELSSYFLSPIGYLVLGAMALILWNQYRIFLDGLKRAGQAEVPLPEPIVAGLFLDFLPVIAIMLLVPVLTMRLVAEERRTGSMEVLLTAPVNEWPVVLSKFLATWLFFLLTWLPAGLFLVALRMEVGQPFDYRPLLSFYVCIAAQGLAFVGMGLFFSTLTKNQIIAAVLTFAGMLLFFIAFLIRREQVALGVPPFIQAALSRLSYVHMWIEAGAGRLPLRDVLLFSSLGVFWLFLSVKVLETRKWS
jgi:ABC-type transport system involved in multi-copper enzyme maturation permease subunit